MGKFIRTFIGGLTGNVDWIDAVTLGCIGIVGLFILLSIQQALFIQQSIYLVLALLLVVVISRIDAHVIQWFAPFGYILVVILLIVSYLGPTIRGATRWIMIAGVQLQPSELVKPILLLFYSWVMTKYPPRNLRYAGFHILLFVIPFLLVFKQPDLGSSLVYSVFWLSMMIAAGFPIGIVVVATLLGSLFLPGLWQALHQYQRDRILTFLDPALDPKGAGYNALQSMIAVGSGQWIGRGLGRGTQSHLRFLPEFHTDFIFATLVEELGFVGGFALFFGYAILLWRIIAPLVKGTVVSLFPFLFSVGLFTMLLTQIIVNTGMNMGIIPITGITLPFVSYGGSSLLSIGLSFGILWSLRRKRSGVFTLQ